MQVLKNAMTANIFHKLSKHVSLIADIFLTHQMSANSKSLLLLLSQGFTTNSTKSRIAFRQSLGLVLKTKTNKQNETTQEEIALIKADRKANKKQTSK